LPSFPRDRGLLPLETHLSCDSVKEIRNTAHHLPPTLHGKYIALLSEPGVPPHKLHLKVGTIYSVICNPYIEKGLVKNVRVRVAELHRHIVRVELLRDQSTSIDGRFFYLPRISFDFQPRQTSWTVERRQFPLQLAYATTFKGGTSNQRRKRRKSRPRHVRFVGFSAGLLIRETSAGHLRRKCLDITPFFRIFPSTSSVKSGHATKARSPYQTPKRV
jgi:hypothetical protein